MTKKIKKLIPFIALLAMLATLSSCNRGMGCPTFSVGDVVTEVVDQLPALIVNE